MEVMEVNYSHAEIVGKVHSQAWKETYKNIFPTKYINQDTPEKRKKECIMALEKKGNRFYLIIVQNVAVGIIKLFLKQNCLCEIESLYILSEYRGKGYGSKSIDFIKNAFKHLDISLWVLEKNENAIRFYKENGFNATDKKRIINRGRAYGQIQYIFKD